MYLSVVYLRVDRGYLLAVNSFNLLLLKRRC